MFAVGLSAVFHYFDFSVFSLINGLQTQFILCVTAGGNSSQRIYSLRRHIYTTHTRYHSPRIPPIHSSHLNPAEESGVGVVEVVMYVYVCVCVCVCSTSIS